MIENILVVGASGGIGLGFVKHFLSQDEVSRVYATYRCRESASELLAMRQEDSARLVCLEMDITQEGQIEDCIRQIRTEIACLHRVINCVGLLHEGDLQPEKSLRQLNSEQLLRYFQINSVGAVLLAKHLMPLLSHGNRAIFATLSAKLGSIGDNHLGGWYGYRASKAALNMFMHTVAIEYQRKSPHTIVVTLHPGTTDTRLSQPFSKNVPPEKLFSINRTVKQLLRVMDSLTDADTGEFFSWDGAKIPW